MRGLTTLGAVYSESNDGVKIERIYEYDTEIISQAPPLAKPGVDAKNGDIITAINGRAVDTIADLQKALQNQAGLQTLLAIKRGRQSLEIDVEPERSQRETAPRRTP